MVIVFHSTINGRNSADRAMVFTAATTMFQRQKKVLMLSLQNAGEGRDIEDLADRALRRDREMSASIAGGFEFEDIGIDALLRQASSSRLTVKHFDDYVTQFARRKNFLDIAPMSTQKDFVNSLIERPDDLRLLLDNANEVYNYVFVFVDCNNKELLDIVDSAADDIVIVIGQGQKESLPIELRKDVAKKVRYLISDYEAESAYTKNVIRRLYGGGKFYTLPHNIHFRDAGKDGTLIHFAMKNYNDAENDANYPLVKAVREMMNDISGMKAEDEAEAAEEDLLNNARKLDRSRIVERKPLSELPESQVVERVIPGRKKGFFRKATKDRREVRVMPLGEVRPDVPEVPEEPTPVKEKAPKEKKRAFFFKKKPAGHEAKEMAKEKADTGDVAVADSAHVPAEEAVSVQDDAMVRDAEGAAVNEGTGTGEEVSVAVPAAAEGMLRMLKEESSTVTEEAVPAEVPAADKGIAENETVKEGYEDVSDTTDWDAQFAAQVREALQAQQAVSTEPVASESEQEPEQEVQDAPAETEGSEATAYQEETAVGGDNTPSVTIWSPEHEDEEEPAHEGKTEDQKHNESSAASDIIAVTEEAGCSPAEETASTVTVESQEPDAGPVWKEPVHVQQKEKRPGFFARLFGFGKKSPAQAATAVPPEVISAPEGSDEKDGTVPEVEALNEAGQKAASLFAGDYEMPEDVPCEDDSLDGSFGGSGEQDAFNEAEETEAEQGKPEYPFRSNGDGSEEAPQAKEPGTAETAETESKVTVAFDDADDMPENYWETQD